MQEPTTHSITFDLPSEFVHLCQLDQVDPATVLRGFIADLCGITGWIRVQRTDGYSSNGSDERQMARQYYYRVGYHYNRQG